ncbi:MAG TPA: VOC family protein [Devosiaceae bacterium]|nr:VOC family protein [Devosiaceae bacterium]
MDPNNTHGAPSWIEYSGPDAGKSRKFYEDVLDWSIKDMPMGDGSNYAAIALGEKTIGGFNPRPAPGGGWTVYITVDDVDKRFKKAIAAGAKAAGEPMDVPGVGRMAHIVDPSGAPLAFIRYAN